MKHEHELDGKLHEGCGACDYARALLDPVRTRAHKEVDNDLGQIAKTAMKAKPGRPAKYG